MLAKAAASIRFRARSVHDVALCSALTFSGACHVYDGGLLALEPSEDAAVLHQGDAAGFADAGSLLLEGTLNDSRDAGSGANGECWWCRTQTAGSCTAAAPPPYAAPQGDSEPSSHATDLAPIYLAWTNIDLGARVDGAANAGFDLDGVCTNSQTCPTQRNVVACAARSVEVPFDGALCRDNSLAKLIQFMERMPGLERDYGFSQAMLNCGLTRGSFNVLLRISGYDGTPDDSQVRVDWYTSSGLAQPPSWQCDAQAVPAQRLWRSSSSWLVDARELTGPITTPGQLPISRVADAHAYVRGGYLVSRFGDDAALRLAPDAARRSLQLPMHDNVLMARLRWQQDNTWQLDQGTLAGRASADEVMSALRELGLCAGQRDRDQLYGTLFDFVNESADLPMNGQNDPRTPCDGLSIGIGFAAVQVLPGAAVTLPAPVQCCAPGLPLEQCSPSCGDARLEAGELCDPSIIAGAGACPTRCMLGDCAGEWQGDGCEARCVMPGIDDAVDAGDCSTLQTN
jgi:hypothetical protein